MKKIFLIIGIMLLFLGMTTRTFSQGSFSLSGALSLPTGDFAEDDGSGAGMAESGYGALVEYSMPVISSGLKYQTDLETIKVYGLFQLSYNISMIGDWEMTDVYYGGEPADISYEFENSNSFGIIIGGGILISERFNISARYYGLGETEIDEATATVNGDEMDWSDAEGEDFEISMFVIT